MLFHRYSKTADGKWASSCFHNGEWLPIVTTDRRAISHSGALATSVVETKIRHESDFAMIAFMGMSNLDKSCFLNVDLEIFSKSDLQPLVAALGSKIHLHYLGTEFRLFKAYFDLAEQPKTPEHGILRYCKLIQKLPPKERALWDAAKSRSFDIGIEAPKRETYYWSAVGSDAIRAAAEVGAQIAITVYGPMRVARLPKKKQLPSSPK
jgi:hypothetical protein